MIESSCHCGAVKLEIGAAPEEVNDCNCSRRISPEGDPNQFSVWRFGDSVCNVNDLVAIE
jgi:hypothetical protein